eukprot:UN26043
MSSIMYIHIEHENKTYNPHPPFLRRNRYLSQNHHPIVFFFHHFIIILWLRDIKVKSYKSYKTSKTA